MVKKINNKKGGLILFIGSLLLLVAIVLSTQGLSVIPQGNTVWIPDYTTVSCEQTRLECVPGVCVDEDSAAQYDRVDQDGEWFHCGTPTLSDANYYEGCTFLLKSEETFFDFTSIKICDDINVNCQNAENTLRSRKLSGKRLEISLLDGEVLWVDPTSAKYFWRSVSPVYGIKIGGATKPQYSDRCNVASLLDERQLAVIKGSDDYVRLVNAGEISPGNFPGVYISGYKASYSDQRVLIFGGDSWFVESIGKRCLISQDTNNRFIVTDNCVGDSSIECFPNIGNCDSRGRITVDGDGKVCVPGTLIGSSTQRIAISSSEACKIKCNANGLPENYDCVTIPKCSDGKVLSSNYDCVTSTRLSAEDKCKADEGRWIESKNDKGQIVGTCDYSGVDNTLIYIILGVVGVMLFMIGFKINRDKKGVKK